MISRSDSLLTLPSELFLELQSDVVHTALENKKLVCLCERNSGGKKSDFDGEDSKWFMLKDSACDDKNGSDEETVVVESTNGETKKKDSCRLKKSKPGPHKKTKVIRGNTSFSNDMPEDSDMGEVDMNLAEERPSQKPSLRTRLPAVLLEVSEEIRNTVVAATQDVFQAQLGKAPQGWSNALCDCAGPGTPLPGGLTWKTDKAGEDKSAESSKDSKSSSTAGDDEKKSSAEKKEGTPEMVKMQFAVHRSTFEVTEGDTPDKVIKEANNGDKICDKTMSGFEKFGSGTSCDGPEKDISYLATFEFCLSKARKIKMKASIDWGRGGMMIANKSPMKLSDGKSELLAQKDKKEITSQFVMLKEGKNVIQLVGFEDCCDSDAQEIQYQIDSETAPWMPATQSNLASSLGTDLVDCGSLPGDDPDDHSADSSTDAGQGTDQHQHDGECGQADYKGWAQFMGRYMVQNHGRAPNLFQSTLKKMEESPELKAWIDHLKATAGTQPKCSQGGAGAAAGSRGTTGVGAGAGGMAGAMGGGAGSEGMFGLSDFSHSGGAVDTDSAFHKAAGVAGGDGATSTGGSTGGSSTDQAGLSKEAAAAAVVAANPDSCFKSDAVGEFLKRIFRPSLKWAGLDPSKVEKDCVHWEPWFEANPQVAKALANGADPSNVKSQINCLCPRYAVMRAEEAAASGEGDDEPKTPEEEAALEKKMAEREALFMTRPFSNPKSGH